MPQKSSFSRGPKHVDITGAVVALVDIEIEFLVRTRLLLLSMECADEIALLSAECAFDSPKSKICPVVTGTLTQLPPGIYRHRRIFPQSPGYALKKLWTEKEHLRWQEIRTRGERTRRRVSKEKKRERNREKSGTPGLRTERRKDILPWTQIEAPAVFSLIDNPEGTISFVNRVRQAGRDHHVQIQLENLTALGPAAVALLLSMITQPEMGNTSVAGNYPNDAILGAILEGTGFFDHVRRPGPSGPTRVSGRMYRLSRSRQVMPQTAMDLSAFAMKLLTGSEQKGAAESGWWTKAA